MENEFKPDWVSAPGETIRDILEERNITEVEFAKTIGLDEKKTTKLLSGQLPIDHALAVSLERALGAPSSFWLQREADYRRSLLDELSWLGQQQS